MLRSPLEVGSHPGDLGHQSRLGPLCFHLARVRQFAQGQPLHFTSTSPRARRRTRRKRRFHGGDQSRAEVAIQESARPFDILEFRARSSVDRAGDS